MMDVITGCYGGRVPLPRMWGRGFLTRRPFRESGVFSGSQSLEAKVKLIIIIHSVAVSLKHSERRREGRGCILGPWCAKGHSVLEKQHGSFSKVKQNDHRVQQFHFWVCIPTNGKQGLAKKHLSIYVDLL